jgi:dUTP pyrophosphatase
MGATPPLQPVDVRIRRLAHGADLPLPSAQSSGSAGMDLHAAVPADQPAVVRPGAVSIVPCGFAMAVPAGWEAQVRPRSGLAAKHAITVANAPGTIDSDYRGEVKVLLANLGPEDFHVSRGMRIAQLLLQPVYRVTWVEVAELPETERGAGGFGSTGR